MRRLLGWTLAVLMTAMSFAPAAALHQQAEQGMDAGDVDDAFGAAQGMAEGAVEELTTERRMLEAFGRSAENADAIRRAGEGAGLLDDVGRHLKSAGTALGVVDVLDHLSDAEWTDAGKSALAKLTEFGAGKALARTAFGGVARLAATALCTALTAGAGAMICMVAVGGAAAYLASEGFEAAAGAAVDGLKQGSCALFPGAPGCDAVRRQVAGRRAEARGGGGASMAGRPGGGSGGRATRIDAQARDIVTVATGGGKAVTEVGVSGGGGGQITAIAGDIVTIGGAGKSARTSVGTESGTTVVKGEILNYGGVIDVNNNTTKRDGRRCLTFYLSTCIIHILYRRPSDPCPPGYWPARGRQCLLPSDLQHRISR